VTRPRCRVLVVEDEAIIAMLLEDMVEDFGSEVVGPIASLRAALHTASDTSLDAAILDNTVGGEVVFPVADVLHERGVPVIFATGYGASVLPARFAGCRSLAKPLSFDMLADALQQVLADQPCHLELA
jgi:DNA-binding NtrC family response regulator